ncbi:MAG: exodeoxyribonuclease VII large subunit [Firmicutes bacterium]|nr:exodeoxyribonuclease VII large subunit [Bacillota bacterium]MBR6584659.1 exodeoxyribonuclease VII large subunit [Bacillota bacterium]
MALKPVSVSQLNEYISRVLMTDPLLGNISVTGEISNLKYHSTGHVYFSINDANSKINCFFPSSYVRNLNYELGDGLEVIINGYINVYKKGGTYTLFVRSVTVAGEGNLAMAFQFMKDKLDSEGLFDQAHKKPIPAFPRRIGIVTSETGAAVQDILKIITSRNNLVNITIFPVQVQGNGAAADIAAMLDRINADPECADIDTLIVGRGGGSTEDLWAFNEEVVARAIFRSKIPVISAVGHEIDFTISDFVADKRAETPTAAAEMAVPDLSEIRRRLEKSRDDLLVQLNNKVKFDQLTMDNIMADIRRNLEMRIYQYQRQLETAKLILEENNPKNILGKGYSILEDGDGNVISSAEDFVPGRSYKLTFMDGSVVFTYNK